MLADYPRQKNAGISTERLVFGLIKLKLTDLADEFEKYFSPSEDHKGNLIYMADINV